LDRKNDIDWIHVAEVLDANLKNKRKKYISKKQVAKGIADVNNTATVGSKMEQQAKKLDPSIIGTAPVTSPEENQLEDNSGELTYDDLDKEAPEDEQLASEVDDVEDSDDPLDNPMAGSEWQGLDNNHHQ
jgi:hypothetical protein